MKKMTYEEALNKLGEIVKTLEEGSLPLDKSMELFEEGTKLSAFCEKCLNEAEQKIKEVGNNE
ncbi:MAG: exodeoxyribonuclease VII small subunit [Ruminococcaceae bacterium]|nr:exodeoxyribonuclease VII small subunit [Oscillospiraceae bacterium]